MAILECSSAAVPDCELALLHVDGNNVLGARIPLVFLQRRQRYLRPLRVGPVDRSRIMP